MAKLDAPKKGTTTEVTDVRRVNLKQLAELPAGLGRITPPGDKTASPVAAFDASL